MRHVALPACIALWLPVMGCATAAAPPAPEPPPAAGCDEAGGPECQPVCGNGVREAGEACDDGNADESDSCSAACARIGCGDGALAADEACDDGNADDGDGCDANCTPTACGNSVATTGEACDDGNTLAGDGCDAGCQAEPREAEPNDDAASSDRTGAISTTALRVGALSPAGDEDSFKITNDASMERPVRLDLWSAARGLGASCGAGLRLRLSLRTAAGEELATGSDRGALDQCPALSYQLAPGQSVYAHVMASDAAEVPGYALVVMFPDPAP